MVGAAETTMTEMQHSGGTPGPEDEEADRWLANIILLVALVLLVGGGAWLANAMIEARKADECMSSGRRNCNPIDAPAR
jgi:hypothetical protein